MKDKYFSLTDTNFLVKSAVIAALYAVLTLLLPVASFGPIQFRFSEILVLLVFYNKRFIPGLVLGCAIANLFSPMLVFDVIFGTLSSYIAFKLMEKASNLFVASLFPVFLHLNFSYRILFLYVPFYDDNRQVSVISSP